MSQEITSPIRNETAKRHDGTSADEEAAAASDGPSWLDEANDESIQQSAPLHRPSSETSGSLSLPEESDVTWGQFFGAVANLCSATLGAGILALPFAMYEAGLVYGLLLLAASGWGTAASIKLLVEACDTFCLSTYEAVVEKILGRTWRQVVEVSILIFCGGTAVAYVIAVGDIMERVEDVDGARKQLAMSLVWLLAMLPLSCLRRMQSLQCASSVGILSIGTLLLAATVHLFVPSKPGFSLDTQDLESFLWPNHGGISVLRACPIFFFAFSCQVNVAQIYDELPGPRGGMYLSETRVRTMGWVTIVAVALCSLLYASISLVTLLDFGEKVQPNILSCYKLGGSESALLHLAFLGMALAVVMAFPLNVFPARVSVIQMWETAKAKRSVESLLLCTDNDEAHQPLLEQQQKITTYDSDMLMERGLVEDPLQPPRALTQESTLTEDEDQQESESDLEPRTNVGQHILVTLVVAGSALGLALVVPNISVVFGLLGGTTSALLGFVVPGLLGLKMNRSDYNAWILVVAGAAVGILTTGVTVYSTF